jgi:hypothetical protein
MYADIQRLNKAGIGLPSSKTIDGGWELFK